MKRYTVTFELDENRTTCLDCPLCDCEDNCMLQPDNQHTESWQELLGSCPLEEATHAKTY